MEGLYQRARALRREERLLSLIRKERPLEEGDFEISSNEGKEILDHLDDVVSRKKITLHKGIFSFNPQKSGVFFPVLVNVIAFAAVITGIVLFAYFSKVREDSIVLESGLLLSTEGKLIEKLKQESEAKLQVKDTEIAEARKKLAEINEERNLLQLEMENRIQGRENELREQLAAELEEERKRLQAGGQSTDDIEARLRRLEIEKTEEYDAQLAAFARKTTEEAEQKTAAMQALQNDYEKILLQRQTEQQALREELQKQLESEAREREALQSSISEDLNRLQKQRQDEQLILDQIRSSYEQVNIDLSNSNYESALNRLTTLKKYITRNSIASLPLVKSRSGVELFIIDSITRLIETEQSGPDIASDQMIEADAQLTLVSNLVEQGNTSYRTGDMERAAAFYIQALTGIPIVRQSYEQLKAIDELTLQQDRASLNGIIARGDQLFEQQDFPGALEMYEQAVSFLKIDADTLQNLMERIAESGSTGKEGESVEELQAFVRNMEAELNRAREETQAYESERTELQSTVEAGRLAESRRKAVIDHISSIQNSLTSYTGLPDRTTERSQDELFALLQTKLLLKQVLNSEAIRTEYPVLYDAVENYFRKYGEDKRIEGEYSALQDIISFIDILTSSDTDTVLDPEWYDGSSEIKRTLYGDLLDTLRKLLE